MEEIYTVNISDTKIDFVLFTTLKLNFFKIDTNKKQFLKQMKKIQILII